MKLCKADRIRENTFWWTSNNYTKRLSHKERSRRTHSHFSKERREKGTHSLLKEIVEGEISSMIKELLEEVALVEREAFCENEAEEKNGFYPRDIDGFFEAIEDIRVPRTREG